MVAKKIIIVRHGETDYNQQNIVQGSGVDMPLNSVGKQQASMFYNRYKDFGFKHIFISSLIRTRQSVHHFLEVGIPYTILPELNEISWGELEGKHQSNAEKELYWNTVNQWKAGELDAKIPGGESPIELQQRQISAKLQLLQSPHNNVLVCMHGRALKSFLCLLLDLPLTRMEEFLHSNLCVYELYFDGTQVQLLKANDTTHLTNEE